MADTCRHVKEDGEPCAAGFGLCPECGMCWSHDPCRAEERAAAKSRGGKATAAKRKGVGVSGDDLPPLETVADCETWFRLIARLAITNGVTASAAQEANRAVRELRETLLHDQSEQLREAQSQIKTLHADLKRLKDRA